MSISKHIPEFERLQNPTIAYSDWSVKDVCVYYEDTEATFYLFFSAFCQEPFRTHLVEVTTKYFISFFEPIIMEQVAIDRRRLAENRGRRSTKLRTRSYSDTDPRKPRIYS